jgi:tRNA threonylcarbamoyl adenosine modification protein YeaZ
MKLGLLIDTSQPLSFASICKDGVSLNHAFFSVKSSASFLSEVKNFLESLRLQFKNLSYIAVGVGPGSFIGTRVGVILAKSLCYGLNIPLISFCSMQLFCSEKEGQFMIMTDAKSKGVYALEGTKNQGSVKHKTHPKLLSLEEIEKLDFKEIFAISPENLLLEEKFQTLKLNIAPSKYNLENLSTFCFEKFTNFSEESKEEIEIHYLRLS